MGIVWVDWGLANIAPDGTIYLNKVLKEDDILREHILTHEYGHDVGEQYTLHDLLHDSRPDMRVWLFMVCHPSTWCDLQPFRRLGGRWGYDHGVLRIYVLVSWLTVIGHLFLTYW